MAEPETGTPPGLRDPKDLLHYLRQPRLWPGVPGASPWIKLLSLFERRRRTHIKLAANTWGDLHPNKTITITLYRTVIARFDADGTSTYHTDGWRTKLTMERMSRWIAGGWTVYTLNRQWYWANRTTGPSAWDRPEVRQPFTDGDLIDKDGTLHPQAAPVYFRRRPRKAPAVESALLERLGGKAGVYADLTNAVPQYYAKCPECGHVHGMYPTYASAAHHQVCGACRHEKVLKYRSDLERAARPRTPKERQKPAWPRSVKEAFDAKDLLSKTFQNWMVAAMFELGSYAGSTVRLVPDGYGADDEADTLENADALDHFDAAAGNDVYTVYRNEEAANEAAVERAHSYFDNADTNDTLDWVLERFSDAEALRTALSADYPAILQARNPFAYARYNVGLRLDTIAEMANFDEDEAAKFIVRTHGRGSLLASDGYEIQLADGVLAYQID